MTCHPYEPGFAECVGYVRPDPPLYPYGPGLPTPPPDHTRPLVSRFEDEMLAPTSAHDVPEPAAAVLLSLAVLALCARWRFRC